MTPIFNLNTPAIRRLIEIPFGRSDGSYPISNSDIIGHQNLPRVEFLPRLHNLMRLHKVTQQKREKEGKRRKNIITDLFSMYSWNWQNVGPEGCITLFYDRIATYAKWLSRKGLLKQNSELEVIYFLLLEIVFIHELSHWKIHMALGDQMSYSSDDQMDFHEALAQFFTYWAVEEDLQTREIFLTFSAHQPARYQLWEKLLKVAERVSYKQEAINICKFVCDHLFEFWDFWAQDNKGFYNQNFSHFSEFINVGKEDYIKKYTKEHNVINAVNRYGL